MYPRRNGYRRDGPGAAVSSEAWRGLGPAVWSAGAAAGARGGEVDVEAVEKEGGLGRAKKAGGKRRTGARGGGTASCLHSGTGG